MRTLILLAVLLASAQPAHAIDWGHSTDEPLIDAMRDAGNHMGDREFQRYVGAVNRTAYGKLVRRTGWVVEATRHPSLGNQAAIHISNRVDRAGVSWTIYAPAAAAAGLEPGDQIEWEGVVTKVAANGEVTLADERIVRRIAPQRAGQAAPRPAPIAPLVAMARAATPWYAQSLAQRPIVLSPAPQTPHAAIREAGGWRNPVVRVWVAPTGLIPRAEIVHTSGRADVDQAALDAVRAWRFQPFPAGRGEDQLGEITVPMKGN